MLMLKAICLIFVFFVCINLIIEYCLFPHLNELLGLHKHCCTGRNRKCGQHHGTGIIFFLHFPSAYVCAIIWMMNNFNFDHLYCRKSLHLLVNSVPGFQQPSLFQITWYIYLMYSLYICQK